VPTNNHLRVESAIYRTIIASNEYAGTKIMSAKAATIKP
jgi:hypothetical protein